MIGGAFFPREARRSPRLLTKERPFVSQEWKDELLTWDPNEFGGLKIMRMPCERIWLPDIVLYNK